MLRVVGLVSSCTRLGVRRTSPLCLNTCISVSTHKVSIITREYHNTRIKTQISRPATQTQPRRFYTTETVDWEVKAKPHIKNTSETIFEPNFADISPTNAPQPPARFLAVACRHGDVPSVINLIKEVDIKTVDTLGNTFLHFAAKSGKKEIVALMLALGISASKANSDGRTPLFAATSPEVVKLLIDNGAQVNIKDQAGYTPLHLASYSASPESIKLLVELGADVEAVSAHGVRPLGVSLACNNTLRTEALLESGASPTASQFHKRRNAFHIAASYENAAGIRVLAKHMPEKDCAAHANEINHLGFRPIECAHDASTLEALFDVGANVDAELSQGGTLLWRAASSNNASIVQTLLERNPDVYVSHGYQTPMMAAARSGHNDIVQILAEKGVDINDSIDKRETALFYAAYGGHLSTVQLLLRMGAKYISNTNENPMLAAVSKGHTEVFKFFLESGIAKVNEVTDLGYNALWHVVCQRDDPQAIEMLIDLGVDANLLEQPTGNSLLHAAANLGQWRNIEVLVKRCELDINFKNKDGESPLYFSANKQTVQTLLQLGAKLDGKQRLLPRRYGPVQTQDNYQFNYEPLLELATVDPAIKNTNDLTALHAACAGGNVDLAKNLISKGAHIEAVSDLGRTPVFYATNLAMLNTMIEAGASLTRIDKDGMGVIHTAAGQAEPDCLNELVRLGASVNAKSTSGSTPIMVATHHYKYPAENIKRLVELGADINAVDNDGDTALNTAIHYKFLVAMMQLVKSGARMDIRNNDGKLPLEYLNSKCFGHPAYAAMLMILEGSKDGLVGGAAT